MSAATPSGDVHDTPPFHHPSPRLPPHRLSPSPKRPKNTPSPHDHHPEPVSSSSSRPRSKASNIRRPESEMRRLDRHAVTSPWRCPEDQHAHAWGLSSRRREMSVPLLSQSLSSFSLSHSPPPGASRSSRQTSPTSSTPAGTLFNCPTPPQITSSTPRRPPIMNMSTPFGAALPKDHVYPSTAPLPQLSSFLGSPFSSRTARGGYNYRVISPSKGAMTERIAQDGFDKPRLDWDRSEWMVGEALGLAVQTEDDEEKETALEIPQQSSRLRRETSGSTSSMEDYSGSAASSTSLLSLGRSSGELQNRPTFVTIWGEGPGMGSDGEEEEDPSTPSRQLFSISSDFTDNALRMSIKTADPSPGMSPLIGRSGNSNKSVLDGEVSPLQAFLMSATPSNKFPTPEDCSPSPVKPRSPLASFFPRLLSSTKGRKGETTPKNMSPREQHSSLELETINKSGQVTPLHGLGLTVSPNSCPPPYQPFGFPQFDESSGVGLGVGPLVRSVDRRSPFARSVSTISSEIDPSPSRPPSYKYSSGDSSTSTLYSTLSASPLAPPKVSTLINRRKSLAIQNPNKAKLTPIIAVKSRHTRPLLRRGITEPDACSKLLSPAHTETSTPVSALFGDVKPSPAAFASTGLVKKKSAIPGLEIPKFGGDSEPSKRVGPVPSPVKPVRSRLAIMTAVANDYSDSRSTSSASRTSDGSVSVYVRAAQRTRGLRRKTSTMFAASESSGSTGDGSGDPTSPLTPTRPGIKITPIGLGVTSPSPITPTNIAYPFAPATTLGSSPPRKPLSGIINGNELSSPAERASLSTRACQLRARPLARSSNPMLAASFRAAASRNSDVFRSSSGYGGSRLETDFVIVQSLGKGEFSHVWKVKEKASGTLFAVKAGRPYTGYKNRLRQLEEVSILRRLSLEPHPHVITFVDSWEHANRLYICTELSPCGDLAVFLLSMGDTGGMGEARMWKVLSELSSGLAYIHSNNFLHLDIKPSNILITADGSLKIADFGMSTVISSSGQVGGLSPVLPQSGEDGGFVWGDAKETTVPVPSPILDREVEGDREYLCPEALGEGVVGKEADVFSLGILLLEAALNVVLPSNGDGWVKLRNDDFSDLMEHFVIRQSISQPFDQSATRPVAGPNGITHNATSNEIELGDDIDHETAAEAGIESQKETLPQVSEQLLEVIKGMMISNPAGRMTLEEVAEVPALKQITEMRADCARQAEDGGDIEVKGGDERKVGAALVGEGEWFLPAILGA